MRRPRHALLLALCLAISACGTTGKSAKKGPGFTGPNLGPHDDVGDVVTGSMSSPSSPGVLSPSQPGGPGGGGGTIRPK